MRPGKWSVTSHCITSVRKWRNLVRWFACVPGLRAPPPCRPRGTMSIDKAVGSTAKSGPIRNVPSGLTDQSEKGRGRMVGK
jgi:hypothetical protein